jgi:hypothetical protein
MENIFLLTIIIIITAISFVTGVAIPLLCIFYDIVIYFGDKNDN